MNTRKLRQQVLQTLYDAQARDSLQALDSEYLSLLMHIPLDQLGQVINYLAEKNQIAIVDRQLGTRLYRTIYLTSQGMDFIEGGISNSSADSLGIRDPTVLSGQYVLARRLDAVLKLFARYLEADLETNIDSENRQQLQLVMKKLSHLLNKTILQESVVPAAVPTSERSLDDRENIIRLYLNLTTYFDEGELQTLCFHLGVDYESLPTLGKANKARELVELLQRNGRVLELVEYGRKIRPSLEWPPCIEVQERQQIEK
jgi:hypothetical protein